MVATERIGDCLYRLARHPHLTDLLFFFPTNSHNSPPGNQRPPTLRLFRRTTPILRRVRLATSSTTNRICFGGLAPWRSHSCHSISRVVTTPQFARSRRLKMRICLSLGGRIPRLLNPLSSSAEARAYRRRRGHPG